MNNFRKIGEVSCLSFYREYASGEFMTIPEHIKHDEKLSAVWSAMDEIGQSPCLIKYEMVSAHIDASQLLSPWLTRAGIMLVYCYKLPHRSRIKAKR